LRLRAAAPRLDVDEAIGGVERMVEHPPEFQIFDGLADFRHVALHCAHGGIVGLGPREAEQLGAVGQVRLQVGQRIHHAFELLFFPAEFLRALRVVPDLRVFELLRDRA
jgi:hypothetical protein